MTLDLWGVSPSPMLVWRLLKKKKILGKKKKKDLSLCSSLLHYLGGWGVEITAADSFFNILKLYFLQNHFFFMTSIFLPLPLVSLFFAFVCNSFVISWGKHFISLLSMTCNVIFLFNQLGKVTEKKKSALSITGCFESFALTKLRYLTK